MNPETAAKIAALKAQIDELQREVKPPPPAAAPTLRVFTGQCEHGRIFAQTINGQQWRAGFVNGDYEGLTKEAGSLLDAVGALMRAAADEHNGWPNYETWLVGLWIFDTDQKTYQRARAIATTAPSTSAAADQLQKFAKVMARMNAQPGFVAEIIGAVFSRVDWRRLAERAREE